MADVDNNAVLASLGNTADPFESGEVDPHSAQGRLLRVLQAHRMNDDYQMILNASHKPKLSEYDQNLQKLAPYIGNPRDASLTKHYSDNPANNFILNALLGPALMGMRGSMPSAGAIAPPEMGAMFMDKVAPALPRVNQLPSVVPEDFANNAADVFNTTGGDNMNHPPIARPNDLLSIVQKHDPYRFRVMDQNLERDMKDYPEMQARFRYGFDKLKGNPVGPPGSSLIMDNAITQANDPTNYMGTNKGFPPPANDLSPQTPTRPLFRKSNGQPFSQEDLNQLKKLYPSEFPDDPNDQ